MKEPPGRKSLLHLNPTLEDKSIHTQFKSGVFGATALLPYFAFDFLAAYNYILKEESSAFILLTRSWKEYFIGQPLRKWTRASAFSLKLFWEDQRVKRLLSSLVDITLTFGQR